MAEDAVAKLLQFHRSYTALDRRLADQMLLSLSFAKGPSEFTCAAVSRHLETNAWVVEQFEAAQIDIVRRPDGSGRIKITPNRSPSARVS